MKHTFCLALCYLREKRASVLLLTGACAFLFLVTELYHAPMELAVYTSLMLAAGAALAFAGGFSRYRAMNLSLQTVLRQCGTALEDMPEPRGLVEKRWQAVVREVDAARRRAVEQSEAAARDAQEYYTLWAHQIKTPLAAMQLLAQEDETDAKGLFLCELFQTQQYVDMVMNYQRMASITKDLCACKVDVDAVVAAAAGRVRPMLLNRPDVKLDVQATGLCVVSDTKWLGVVVEQLLTNAVKYTRHGFVKVYACDEVLVVEDSGIGIAPSELPLVFERGYTGMNGRSQRHSSGLGLYLCRRITRKLGHTLWLESQQGRGTRALLVFPQSALMLE